MVFLFFFVFTQVVIAQQNDDIDEDNFPGDSGIAPGLTKFGPKDVAYYSEKDIILDRDSLLSMPDTTFQELINYERKYYGGRYMQNLGNIGSPLRPVFLQAPTSAGIDYGYDAFDHLHRNLSDIPYYTSLTPYSYIKYAHGGRNRQYMDAGFSRNIDYRSRLGLLYRRCTANKVYANRNDEDRQTDHHDAVVNFSYSTKNGRYLILAAYQFVNHIYFETGGSRFDYTAEDDSVYNYELVRPRLNPDIRTRDRRNNWRIYQQYQLVQKDSGEHIGVSAFHRFTRTRQINNYSDPNIDLARFPSGANSLQRPLTLYFQDLNFNLTSTEQEYAYQGIENYAGIKGEIGKQRFGMYLRHRIFDNSGTYGSFQPERNQEIYAGGWLETNLSDSIGIYTEAEYMPGHDYRVFGKINSSWFEGEATQVLKSPTLIDNGYIGNHFAWNNTFNRQLFTSLLGRLTLKWKDYIDFNPFVQYLNIQDYIFYGTEVRPEQNTGSLDLLYAGINFKARWWKVNFQTTTQYSLTSNENVLPVPAWHSFSMLYFRTKVKPYPLEVQIGFSMDYRSQWFGPGFMPGPQKFHIQNDLALRSYPEIDLFADLKIKKVVAFMKFNHLNQNWGLIPSYFTTPYYLAMPRYFEFGLFWMFFD